MSDFVDFGDTTGKLPEGWYEATIVTIRFDKSPNAGTPMAVLVLSVPESRRKLTFYLFLNSKRMKRLFMELLTTLNINLESRKYSIDELEALVEPIIGKRVKFHLYYSRDGYYRVGGFRPSAYEHTYDYDDADVIDLKEEDEGDDGLPPF